MEHVKYYAIIYYKSPINIKDVNTEMDNYKVNVPVKLNIWIRPECQKRQMGVIKIVKPSVVFLQSDGGRNEKEWEAIIGNRKMVEDSIDWDCKIFKIYEDHNNGLYAMGKKTRSVIWANVDRCIFMEDDQIPSISFFRYCEELLEKYQDDMRIECICGMNHLGISENVNSDYFFSRQGSVWGYATWKNREVGENSFDYCKDPYIMELLKERTKNNALIWKRIQAYSNSEIYEGHPAANEFWTEFHMYSQNRLQIIPKKNMICNIGATDDAAHSDSLSNLPKAMKKIYNMKTYELDFPIKHAKYVIPDIKYENARNSIMAYNQPVKLLLRKFERALLIIRSRGVKGVCEKITKNKKTEL